jgi:hypothetical protein
LHTSNLYHIREQEQLSDKLAELSGMQEIFFCNSGCEANEAAIKLARFYGHKKGIDSPTIIVMEKAFHGRTMATLSATGNRKAQAGFEPLVSGFVRVPYDDWRPRRLPNTTRILAVMIIQGEVHPSRFIEFQRLAPVVRRTWLAADLDEVHAWRAPAVVRLPARRHQPMSRRWPRPRFRRADRRLHGGGQGGPSAAIRSLALPP